MRSHDLIDQLVEITRQNLNAAQALKELPTENLTQKRDAKSWSALECIEHLNRYGDFYLPEIDQKMRNSTFGYNPTFKTGWLGNYFAKSMLPKEKLNKMNTFASMNPINSSVSKSVLDTFIVQQEQILQLLSGAREADLTRLKTSISISKWIRLRLGDTFRVVIYHNLRHIQQAERAVSY